MAVLVQHLLPQSPGHIEYIQNLIRSKIAMQLAQAQEVGSDSVGLLSLRFVFNGWYAMRSYSLECEHTLDVSSVCTVTLGQLIR